MDKGLNRGRECAGFAATTGLGFDFEGMVLGAIEAPEAARLIWGAGTSVLDIGGVLVAVESPVAAERKLGDNAAC